MKVLHVVPEINEANGVYQVAWMLAREDGGELIDCSECSIVRLRDGGYGEVWVHGMWLPREWKACWRIVRLGDCSIEKRPKLVRMTHGSLSPIYLEKQGRWKKRLVAPIERWLFRNADRVVVTCEAEKKWCQEWGLENEFQIVDLKRFFRLDETKSKSKVEQRNLHVLYLGRRHPLKGVKFLERAAEEINQSFEQSNNPNNRAIDLRIVSDHFGEELERDWAWCDVLVLPTLSENFGLVVAEALERGKRVITTDGAPVWGEGEMFECSECSNVRMGYGGRLVYLKGYRDGTDEERVRLLKGAIMRSAD